MFGSGFGDKEADQTPVLESVIDYNNGRKYLSNQKILIPASSVKGVLSHRMAFHYNNVADATWSDIDPSEKSVINIKKRNKHR